MEKEIAYLLNIRGVDKNKLQELLEEYLLAEVGHQESDSDEAECLNDGIEDDPSLNTPDEFDMALTDADVVLKNIKENDDLLTGERDIEFDKASKFQ